MFCLFSACFRFGFSEKEKGRIHFSTGFLLYILTFLLSHILYISLLRNIVILPLSYHIFPHPQTAAHQKEAAGHPTSPLLISLHFFLNPHHDHIYQIFLLHMAQFSSRLHLMPLPDTFPTASCCGMLRNEYWMATHRCLLPIVWNHSRSLPLCNEIPGVLPNRLHTFVLNVFFISLLQMKTTSEFRIPQPLKKLCIPLILCHHFA